MTTLIIIIAVVILIFIFFFLKKEKISNIEINNRVDRIDYSGSGVKAEKIVNDYGEALAQGTSGIARPISLLKNSKVEIKQSFIAYILSLKTHNVLTDELFSTLSASYSYLDHFIADEEVEIINKLFKQQDKNENIDPNQQKLFQDFMLTSILTMNDKMQELRELVK